MGEMENLNGRCDINCPGKRGRLIRDEELGR